VTFAFIEAEKANFPITVMCRVLGVTPSGFHAWCGRPPSERSLADAALTATIRAIHAESRGTYGSPRVHAELRLGHGVACGRSRVERLMAAAGLVGVHRRRRHGCTRRDDTATSAEDLVKRVFGVTGRDRLWLADITEHHTWEGKVYLAVVIDAFSRRVVGWSIADHLRAELVCDALDMAVWTRRPGAGAIHHSDHGCQYTSYAFGRRLRDAGLLGSMGSVGDCYDNAAAESFFATCRPSCSTAAPGPPARCWPAPSSNTSRPGTTPDAATRHWATSVPSPSRPPTPSVGPSRPIPLHELENRPL
jgi:transposase InsO family protein